ncbi:hypothetical protein H9650_11435 [Psychrobacillus sp. Sa2BUA9]|uniref:Uncharacterized protein n=1 Tax=Psychrobacillus faecigallinarum TaxID=2762235 RepID=A0ABR8RAB3_9BACI|nr:hypothetical protein [Psychrobacillus faecigallinarum]MBD7944728.1 hypothetical protein [Psychrobacillus faecigallinarum]
MGTLQTELIEKGLKRPLRQGIVKKNTSTSKQNKERFSRREIEDLMGCNRQVYKRVGGAVRNKR